MLPSDVDFFDISFGDDFEKQFAEAINIKVDKQPLNYIEAMDAKEKLQSMQNERTLLRERIQIERDLQKENIKQRNKLINFFVWLISAQFVSVLAIVVFCIHLMRLDLLSQYEYDWVLSVLRAYFIVISLEVFSLFGVVVVRFFGSKKEKLK